MIFDASHILWKYLQAYSQNESVEYKRLSSVKIFINLTSVWLIWKVQINWLHSLHNLKNCQSPRKYGLPPVLDSVYLLFHPTSIIYYIGTYIFKQNKNNLVTLLRLKTFLSSDERQFKTIQEEFSTCSQMLSEQNKNITSSWDRNWLERIAIGKKNHIIISPNAHLSYLKWSRGNSWNSRYTGTR